jgi:S-DNA-T family DNA segregation ATPase FtsK/SpoIIIE
LKTVRKISAYVSHLRFTKDWIASFLSVRLFFLSGIFLIVGIPAVRAAHIWFCDLLVSIIVVSVLFFVHLLPELGGAVCLIKTCFTRLPRKLVLWLLLTLAFTYLIF